MALAVIWLAWMCVGVEAAPAQPNFQAENGIWLYEGKPFVETTAHAVHHTFRRDPEAALEDLRGLADAGFNTAEVYWIWDRDQREDGTFDFTAFDDFVLAGRKLGLRNFAAVMHHTPDWLASQRGWFHLDEDGQGRTTDGFYVCDPTFWEESDRFVTALLEHLRERPEVSSNILYFALGGEYYPFRADRESDTGYEEATVQAFREGLRERHTLGELGQRWNNDAATYATWDDVWPAVRRQQTDFRGHPLARWNAAAWDWYEFRAQQVTAFFEHTLQLIRGAGETRPITHEFNVGTPGQRRLMRWDALTGDGSGLHLATMDFSSEYDYADMLWWIALSRGCSHPPQQNNEFSGHASWHWLTRHAWAMQALGASGLNVWDWRSSDWGLQCPDRTPRDGLAAGRRFSAQVRALGELFAGSRPLAEEIAILLLDEEDFWRPHAHETEVKQLFGQFLAHGLGGQVVVVANPALCDERLADTRLLIVPHLRHVRRQVAERLAAFVEDGGVLWLLPGCFVASDLDEPYPIAPCPPLDRVAGLRAAALEEPLAGVTLRFAAAPSPYPLPRGEGRVRETTSAVLLDDLQVDGAEVLATVDGRPALTRHQYGRGLCLYQAAELADLRPMLEGWEGRTAAAVRELAALGQPLLPDEHLAAIWSLAGIAPVATAWDEGARAASVLAGARLLERGALVFLGTSTTATTRSRCG